ncbi:uncharacterized protein LOC122849300 isoform X2 [Aphidius gifuensis]|uniref:uncharacterized protein LOC122849300 isoform X2 n=1 Tax=Aphidius gifuensis TaxID=684658 RepID=UPI001CDB6CF2|nr:uncharacterized protein LOC122849300 isoform X2 [Aphidius gifuensis]
MNNMMPHIGLIIDHQNAVQRVHLNGHEPMNTMMRWTHLHGEVYIRTDRLRFLRLDSPRAKTASSQLIKMLVPQEVLQTHSVSCKRSPALPDRGAKPPLDPRLIEAIYQYVITYVEPGARKSSITSGITYACNNSTRNNRRIANNGRQ